jgi:hypothetical protein
VATLMRRMGIEALYRKANTIDVLTTGYQEPRAKYAEAEFKEL